MKIYQKILIGIAVGFIFGALLGPQSLVFHKDTLHVVDPSALEIRTVAEESGSRITLPKVNKEASIVLAESPPVRSARSIPVNVSVRPPMTTVC